MMYRCIVYYNANLELNHPDWVHRYKSNYRYNMESTHLTPRIAIISTGIENSLVSKTEMGWCISVQQERLKIDPTVKDSMGQGTELALCLSRMLPSATLIGIDIFNGQGKTTSTLLLKAIEKAIDLKCDAVLVCVHSLNAEKRPRFAKVCAYAHKHQIPIVSSGVSGKVSYPSQIPTVFGALSHVDCRSRMYVYDRQFFDAEHPNRGLFVLNGWWQGRYVGPEIGAVHLMATIIQLLENGTDYESLFEAVSIRGFVPFTEFGFV